MLGGTAHATACCFRLCSLVIGLSQFIIVRCFSWTVQSYGDCPQHAFATSVLGMGEAYKEVCLLLQRGRVQRADQPMLDTPVLPSPIARRRLRPLLRHRPIAPLRLHRRSACLSLLPPPSATARLSALRDDAEQPAA